jgi:hypothetical protein
MSVAELIEQIKALPPDELEVVRSFVLNGETEAQAIRYIDRDRARSLGGKILDENEELFRRLAQ